MRDVSIQPLRIHCRVAPPFTRKVKRASLRRAAQAAFESAGEERSGELTLVVTDDARVKELNRVYRGVDSPTDVLAFGDTSEADGLLPPSTIYFGDVVISYPRTVEQAAAYGHPIEEELSLLVVHGVLHLLGYDHVQTSDQEEMWRVQSAALARLGIHWQP